MEKVLKRTQLCQHATKRIRRVRVNTQKTAKDVFRRLGYLQVGLGPGNIVLDGHSAPFPQKGAEPPNFRPIYVVAKWLDGSRCHLVAW